MFINLWNPTGHLALPVLLVTSLLLGMVHGVTPDEHTWPITFSYSIGSYSAKGGFKTGLLFSLTFTLQRAIASELAYFALVGPLMSAHADYVIYLVVGALMAVSGTYILRLNRHVHFLEWVTKPLARLLPKASKRATAGEDESEPRSVPVRMTLLHGFVAGWGTGAFALILYTVIAPAMPSAGVAFVPGLLFGIGTMIMQITIGSLIGLWMQKRRLTPVQLQYVGKKVSGMMLFYGGLGFVLVGFLGLVLPLDKLQFTTGLRIHNLHTIGVGFFLAVILLFGIAIFAFLSTLREVKLGRKSESRLQRT